MPPKLNLPYRLNSCPDHRYCFIQFVLTTVRILLASAVQVLPPTFAAYMQGPSKAKEYEYKFVTLA